MENRYGTTFSFVLYTLLIGIFGISLLLVWPVYQKYKTAQQEVSDLNEKLDHSRAEVIALAQEVHDLEHYPSAAEKVAREKFKLCREGEEIYIYNQ